MKHLACALLLFTLSACSSKKEPVVMEPVMNQSAGERELGCHNRPALVKDCMEREVCSRFGDDFMNYNYCKDQCEAVVKKSCRRVKP